MFPNEIYKRILGYISDYETLKNCRLTCQDFKYLSKYTEEISSYEKIVNEYIFTLYPELKKINIGLYIPTNPRPILENLYSKNLSLIYMSYNGNLLNLTDFIESFILKNCKIKIRTKTSLYWLKINNFGKISSQPFFDNIDEQLIDICRTENLYTNVGVSSLRFPIKRYTLCCHPKTLRSIDFIPPSNVSSYTYQPVIESSSGYPSFRLNQSNPVKYFNFNCINHRNNTHNIITYYFPVRKEDVHLLKSSYPFLKNYSILEDNKLIFISDENKEKKEISLNDENLISAEIQIDKMII